MFSCILTHFSTISNQFIIIQLHEIEMGNEFNPCFFVSFVIWYFENPYYTNKKMIFLNTQKHIYDKELVLTKSTILLNITYAKIRIWDSL